MCVLVVTLHHLLHHSSLVYFYFVRRNPEARVRFLALPETKVVGLERGPLSLVSTAEELLDRKVAAPV
jgi:hypothetical protein